MSLQVDDRGERIDAVVRAVPGVVELYSAAPALLQAIGELPVVPGGSRSLVQITDAEGRISVTASIGVDPAVQAPATAAAVAAVLRAELGPDADVRVRVSRVSPR
jgi:hypothetical protein